MYKSTQHFCIEIRKPYPRFSLLTFFKSNTRRYDYGDEYEHILGFTICNITLGFLWKAKDVIYLDME